MKRIISLLILIPVLFLSSCGKEPISVESSSPEPTYSSSNNDPEPTSLPVNNDPDLIYSIYYYFKQDISDILSFLSLDNPNEHMDDIETKVESVNKLTSALLEIFDSLPDESVISNEDIKLSKENIIKITDFISIGISDIADTDAASFLSDFEKSLMAAVGTEVRKCFETIDPILADKISDDEIIYRNVINEICSVYRVTEYIAVTQSESQNIPEQSCAEVLVSGTNQIGDRYEMVYRKEENYETSVVKFGILKNDKWVLELDNDIFEYNASSHGSYMHMNYVGNGCFMQGISRVYGTGVTVWRYIVYNADTGKKFATEDFSAEVPIPIYKNDNKMIIRCIRYNKKADFTVLNTDDMSTKKFSVKGYIADYSNISEGLFAVSVGTGHPEISFFSAEGVKQQNIKPRKTGVSENYDRNKNFTVVFNNGKCTYDVYNDANTMYTITIDKQGTVLDSYKKY